MLELLDALSLIGSFLLIALVLALTYYASRWYAKRMGAGPGKYIKIVDKAVFGQGSAVVIVKIQEKYYMLASADKNVRLLCELPDFVESEPGNSSAPIPFKQVMRDIINRAGKPGNKKDDGEG